jgi:hypothetical protein
MNIFSTDAYLTTLAEVYFPGKPHSIELYRCEGKVFRLLSVDGQIISTWAFLDFVQPLDSAEGPAQELGYLPKAVLRTTRAEDRPAVGEAPEVLPSPFVDWKLFATWADFENVVKARIGNLFPDSRRKRKKLERDLGPVRFVFDDERPEVFERCVRWKSSQYVATGLKDMFADPLNVEMFRQLHQKKVVVVSSLSAGDTLVAVHFGGLADNRHYWWVPAYDPAQSKYSPGRLMLEAILEESYRAKHSEFDFLIGDEAYKWHYATHNREVGGLGTTPLKLRLRKEAKKQIKQALARYPRLLAAASEWKRRLSR